MHLLRSSLTFIRLVLAWFVLTLGVASAAPLLHPVTMTVVCAEGGTKLMVVDADGAPAASHGSGHTLDCPMCLPAAIPPGLLAQAVPTLQAQPCASHPFASAHIAALTGAPLPPRGPPRLS